MWNVGQGMWKEEVNVLTIPKFGKFIVKIWESRNSSQNVQNEMNILKLEWFKSIKKCGRRR